MFIYNTDFLSYVRIIQAVFINLLSPLAALIYKHVDEAVYSSDNLLN
jgi:hypothetical protein